MPKPPRFRKKNTEKTRNMVHLAEYLRGTASRAQLTAMRIWAIRISVRRQPGAILRQRETVSAPTLLFGDPFLSSSSRQGIVHALWRPALERAYDVLAACHHQGSCHDQLAHLLWLLLPKPTGVRA